VTPTDGLLLAIIGLLLIIAILLALAETSMTRITRVKAMALAEEGRRGAGVLNTLLEHPERFLNTILLVVLIVQTVQTSLATLVGVSLLGPALGSAAAVVFNVFLTFILAEAAPKTWALQHAERAALFTAPFVRALVLFPPLSLLTKLFIVLSNVITPGKGIPEGPFVSEEELLATVDVATQDETRSSSSATPSPARSWCPVPTWSPSRAATRPATSSRSPSRRATAASPCTTRASTT
jgi:putative hemolysin